MVYYVRAIIYNLCPPRLNRLEEFGSNQYLTSLYGSLIVYNLQDSAKWIARVFIEIMHTSYH